MKHPTLKMAAVILGLEILALPASAQEVAGSGSSCRVSLGIQELRCNNCTARTTDGQREWDFRTEPSVVAVHRGGPADGILRPNDAIISVDGQLITTREGGERFSRVEAGEPVSLRIRRSGWERDVNVTPREYCADESALAYDNSHMPPPPGWSTPAPTPPIRSRPADPPDIAVPTAGARPSRGVVADAPTASPAGRAYPPAPPYRSGGRLGFSLQCSRCGMTTETTNSDGNATTTRRWNFSSPPTIDRLERGGPADEAGLRNGDRILSLNGIDIIQGEAGQLLANLDPGQTVRLEYARSDRVGVAMVTADGLPEYQGSGTRWPTGAGAANRYNGVIGDAHVSVEGPPVNVSRSSDGNSHTMVIRSGETVVTIRVPSS